ncbi:hypothetical protein MACJ_001066 [Theileria orientalis]|uniref:Uncharacterized protein n=1 Tax=Theileria orientalis TaxID=68886 RepID=A0A976QS55_THEOR|nr:hypothetical protein MACJ_001066 [Theileria orientalis]
MPVVFRLEDSTITSNFQSLPRRTIVSTSSDNQICVALLDRLYTFKHEKNEVKLTCKANSSSFPRIEPTKYNQPKLDEKQKTYYEDLQRVMCTNSASEAPRYVGIQPKMINRFIWTCWTPKCKIDEGKEVCLLCTITIDNSINLWLPIQEEKGPELYKLENVLDLSNSLIDEVAQMDIRIFGSKASKEESRNRVLFNLATLGFTSCCFLEDPESKDQGFLCVLNIEEYILLVWVSKEKMKEEVKEEEVKEVRRRRSVRSKKILDDEITEMIEEEEEEQTPKRKKKAGEKVLGMSGFSALNKDYFDLDGFDIKKCKDLFPVNSKVTFSGKLACRIVAAVRANSCNSLVAVCRKQLNFDVYFTDEEGLKKFNAQLGLKQESGLLKVVNVKVSETESLYSTEKIVESIKYFRITGSKENELLAGFHESTFLVHDLKRNETRRLECGSLPILSYSLEHQFMDQEKLALVNVVNGEGVVYRLLLDEETKIEIEEVADKAKEFVPCFATLGADEAMTYECLMKGSLLEINYSLANKSVFYNLVLLMSKRADLELFLEYLTAQRSNLVPNGTFFTLKEAENPFNKLTKVEDLLELRNPNDEFYESLLASYPCKCKRTQALTCFALYLFAFMEASGTTPFEKNETVASNRNCEPLLSKMLEGAWLGDSDLLRIFETLNRIYKSQFLSDVATFVSRQDQH